jgi:hypothetical protein
MAEGWNIITRRSDSKGGPDLHGRFIVRIAEKETAVAMVESVMKDAMVLVDSEASPEALERYGVKPGKMLVLVDAPMTTKRPRDPNQLTKSIIDIATGEKPDRDPTPEERGKDPAAVALGKKGGKARADP